MKREPKAPPGDVVTTTVVEDYIESNSRLDDSGLSHNEALTHQMQSPDARQLQIEAK